MTQTYEYWNFIICLKNYLALNCLINKELVKRSVDVSDLPAGIYIIVVDNQHCKFLKK